jgi:hypothetical protein
MLRVLDNLFIVAMLIAVTIAVASAVILIAENRERRASDRGSTERRSVHPGANVSDG